MYIRIGIGLLLSTLCAATTNLAFEFNGSCRPITGEYRECYVSCLPASKEDNERLHQVSDYIGLRQGGWNQFARIEPKTGCSQDLWRRIVGATMLYCKPRTIEFGNCKLGKDMLQLITLTSSKPDEKQS